MPTEYEPYWVLVSNERLPHIGAGLHRIYVSVEPKRVRYKRHFSDINGRVLRLPIWEAMPHVLDEGQNLCTITEALRAYGEINPAEGLAACAVPAYIPKRRRASRQKR